MASKAVAAFFVFAVLCVFMAVINFGALHPYDSPYPTWTTWKVKNYQNLVQRANLVFLGSSLMLTPMGEADANFTNRELDATKHHKSLVFEKAFENITGNKIRTFNFAIPGEMPSDAYLITNFILKGEKRPDVIVYGVGPRDFLENSLKNPSATDPFKYLSRLGDYSKHIDIIKPGVFARLDYELGNLFYPYGKKEDFKTSAHRVTQNLIAGLFPQVQTLNVPQRKNVLPSYHPYEIREQEAYFRPTQEEKMEFKDNLAEYRYRYKKLKWETFNGQMKFFEDLLVTAKQRGIHVVVVAMPITDMNRNLLSPEAKEAYQNNLAQITKKCGATYINMDGKSSFEKNDFADSVHLHAFGGKKFFDILASDITKNSSVMHALKFGKLEKPKAVAELEDSTL